MMDTLESMAMESRSRAEHTLGKVTFACNHAARMVTTISKDMATYRVQQGADDGAVSYTKEDLAAQRGIMAARMHGLSPDLQAVLCAMVAELADCGDTAAHATLKACTDQYHMEQAYWTKHESECSGCPECEPVREYDEDADPCTDRAEADLIRKFY